MKVKLHVVQGRPQGKPLTFPDGEFLFGRGLECHVRPNSDWVSRQHCLLRVTGEGVVLRDLGSRSGTLVNGSRIISEYRLHHGDCFQVGPLVFRLDLEPTDEEPTPAADKAAPPPPHPDTEEMSLLETQRDLNEPPQPADPDKP